jgi:TonB family protein
MGRVEDMGWIEAPLCDLRLDSLVPEEWLLEEAEGTLDLDFTRGSAPDCHLVADSSSVNLLLNNDLKATILGGSSPPPASESCWLGLGLVVSAVAHAALLVGLFCLSAHTATGSKDYRGSAVFVHLMDSDPSVPQEESQGAIESAAAVASLAERRRHTTSESVKRPSKTLIQVVRNEVTSGKEISESVDVSTKTEQIVTEKRHEDDKSTQVDWKDVDSPSRSDSVSSIPSVASPPRGVVPAAGAEAADFRAGVLSAIEETAYFPKKALNKGIHGQAVVQFTFHRYRSITGLALVKTSGSEALDQAAVRILERASKRFPQFPDHFSKESVTYVVPIVFKARSSGGN